MPHKCVSFVGSDGPKVRRTLICRIRLLGAALNLMGWCHSACFLNPMSAGVFSLYLRCFLKGFRHARYLCGFDHVVLDLNDFDSIAIEQHTDIRVRYGFQILDN